MARWPLRHVARLQLTEYAHPHHHVHVLVTGVGMVATAASCSRTLSETAYDLALNIGLCGSFDPALKIGTAVHVTSDRLSELGAEDGERLLTLHELGLCDGDDLPGSGVMVNRDPPAWRMLGSLPSVSGITVNTVHGRDSSIAAVRARFDPQVESMEGAAFMYACLASGVRFAQVRGVSNVVERRNRGAWKLREAVDSACAAVAAMLDEV